jgi:putative heme transporter
MAVSPGSRPVGRPSAIVEWTSTERSASLRIRKQPKDGDGEPPRTDEPEIVQLDEAQLGELSAVFAAPRWLRDLGVASWLLVGALLLLVGLVWLVGATSEITQPVIAAFVVACVTLPLVRRLARTRVGRAGAAGISLLLLLAIGLLVGVLVIGGIVSQVDEIGANASSGADTIQGWLEDVGVSSSGAENASSTAKDDVPQLISTLVNGLVTGIGSLTSLALALSFFLLSMFFLLKDGPSLRAWVESHSGVPTPVARTITGNVITSFQKYFAGVTIVAAFNGVVVGLGALVLGVPLAATIAIVTFVCAYIPYIGAFFAGAFAVVIALGSEGTTDALIMLVIVILANGALQQIVQPIAYGATLELNPLVVLIVTISAGCLFGMLGLVLAAPLTSAGVHISKDLARAKVAAERERGEEPPAPDVGEPDPVPG